MDMSAGLVAPRDIRLAPESSAARLAGDLARFDPSYDIPVVGLPSPLNGQNCTVVRTDVVGFSSLLRTSANRLVIRDAIYSITNLTFKGIVDAWSGDRGDGMLTVIGPGIPTATVIDRIFNRMLPALEKHNSSHDDPTRFQLRVAVDVGPVTGDSMGFNGDAIINISRLVDAPLFKKALVASGASLGLIATDFIYETVLKHDRNVTGCCQVRVNVKEYRRTAWMRVLDTAPSLRRVTDAAVA